MIVDANPVVTACLGLSKPLFRDVIASGWDLFVPEHQLREVRLVTARLAEHRKVDLRTALAWVDATLTAVPSRTYAGYEREARARFEAINDKDWPLVALALATGDDVWSNDVDLFGTGIAVWNTHNIRRMALAGRQHGNNDA